MTEISTANLELGLERSCEPIGVASDQIRVAPPADGMERLGAYFTGRPFSPHRHDTYGIGITTHGVQSFDYRGETRHCLPGQVYVLHPDELHDGRAGTDDGFAYRILYLDPMLFRVASESRALPFLSTPVSRDLRLRDAVAAILSDLDQPIVDLAKADLLAALTDAMEDVSGQKRKTLRVSERAVMTARDLLLDGVDREIGAEALEAATGLDRWSLARQFRMAMGVSPHRYQVLRRVDRARAAIAGGSSLAEAAQQAGFADQSHMTRHFRSALGMTPGAWRAVTVA